MTKLTTTTFRSAAADVRRAIAAYRVRFPSQTLPRGASAEERESEREHRVMINRDCRALERVAALVDAGRLERARDVAWRMDTIVSDQIPRSAWRLMNDAQALALLKVRASSSRSKLAGRRGGAA